MFAREFEIHPSSTQLRLALAAHGLIALAIAAYVEPIAMKVAALVLVALLALRESMRLLRQGTVNLKFGSDESSIELNEGGQPYFFSKYKVYATRWFAILKLIDKHETRTLILNPDRFDSIQSYRRLRYTLQAMGSADVA